MRSSVQSSIGSRRLMRQLILAALLFSAPAAAQPVSQPKPCAVTIARAPQDVRAVVEAWVQTEAQCSVALEVRIVPTDGGYYLLAQDERGGVRERIVPDAQSAGVLVASWIADDNAPPLPVIVTPPPAPERPRAPTTVPASSPSIASRERVSPPGLTPLELTDTETSTPSPTRRWLSAGGLLPLSESSGVGLRIEADLVKRGRWLFGGAASVAESYTPLRSSLGYEGYMTATDVRAVAYVARPWFTGRWELRPTLGFGVMHSSGTVGQWAENYMEYSIEGTFGTAEASFMVHRELGKSWALCAGPLATLILQRYWSDGVSPYVQRYTVDFAAFAGVRRQL